MFKQHCLKFHERKFQIKVSCYYFELKQQAILLDCGEGAFQQIQIKYPKQYQIYIDKIKIIFISHFHIDHWQGIFEILQNKKSLEKIYLILPNNLIQNISDFMQIQQMDTKYIKIICSQHLDKRNLETGFDIQRNNKTIQNQFKLDYIKQLDQNLNQFRILLKAMMIDEFQSIQTIHCPYSNGLSIRFNDGYKFVYSGDTNYSNELVQKGYNADFLIHESTFPQKLQEKANKYNHCSINQSIDVGINMNAKNTLLTHFSQQFVGLPNYQQVKQFLNQNQKYYFQNNCLIAQDFLSIDLQNINVQALHQKTQQQNIETQIF